MLIDHIAIGVDLCSLNIPDFSVGKDGEGMLLQNVAIFIDLGLLEGKRVLSCYLLYSSFTPMFPQPFNPPLMFRFIGVKELDIVCLVSPFLIGSGKLM